MGYYEERKKEKEKALWGKGTAENPDPESTLGFLKAAGATDDDHTAVNFNYLNKSNGKYNWDKGDQIRYSTTDNIRSGEENLFTKKGNEEKENLYLVAYKKGPSRRDDDDDLIHDIEYGVTRKQPEWQNSTNGIYMELDVTNRPNNESKWDELVSTYIKTDDDNNIPWNHWANDVQYKRGTRRRVILKNTQAQNINSIVRSGSRNGTRGHVFFPSVYDLDNGKHRNIWAQSSRHNIDDGGFVGRSSRESLAGEVHKQNIQTEVNNEYAQYENDIIDKNSESNKEANEKNEAKNLAYDRIIQIAKSTGGTGSGQGYVTQRDKILTSKGENMNISLGTSQGSDTVNRIVHTNTIGRTGDGKTIEEILKDANFTDDEIKKIQIGLKDKFKEFYTAEKLADKWEMPLLEDTNSLYNFKMDTFKANEYKNYDDKGAKASRRWEEAKGENPDNVWFKTLGEVDPNIDIINVHAVLDPDTKKIDEKASKDNYLKYDFSLHANNSDVRGIRKVKPTEAEQYAEYNLTTDNEIQFYRDKQLGIQDENVEGDSTVGRLLALDSVSNALADAKNDKTTKTITYTITKEDDTKEERTVNAYDYWQDLGKQYYLNPKDQDDFVTLYRLSEVPEHKNTVKEEFVDDDEYDDEYDPNDPNRSLQGISELESAVTQATGIETAANINRLGILTKNVLNDTINEIQKAKKKEQFLDFMGGLDGFSEVMNMGETMKNSILGDTGIGAMAPYMGDISRMEEGLEKGIQSLGGIQNNVQYNWQQWFDDELTDKYGKNYKKFMPLEEQKNIAKAFTHPTVQQPIYNKETKEFNKDFLEKAGFENTKQLEEFLTNEENFPAYNLDEEDPASSGELDGIHLLAELKGIEVDSEKGPEWKALGYKSKDAFYKDLNEKEYKDIDKLQAKLYNLKTQGYDISSTLSYDGKAKNIKNVLEYNTNDFMDTWINNMEERIEILKEETDDKGNPLYLYDIDEDGNRIKSNEEDDDPNTEFDERYEGMAIENSFARNFINNYLKPRFDQSKSMNEFVEYMDVRAGEQNPFQTQTNLNAVQSIARDESRKWIKELENIKAAETGNFDFEYYFDPTLSFEAEEASYEDAKGKVAQMNKGTGVMALTESAKGKDQRDIIKKHWEDAKDPGKGNQSIGNGFDKTWDQLFYEYGVSRKEIEDPKTFAKIHFQAIGNNPLLQDNDGKKIGAFDPRGDLIHAVKVKNEIYKEGGILETLINENKKYDQVFGTFITPEEYADDIVGSLDPEKTPEAWQEALEGLGYKDFQGGVQDLKDLIQEVVRGGSAMDIRQGIQYLQKQREKPTQERLGITYIERDEDDQRKDVDYQGDTELFKIWKAGGYQGSEDQFYDEFMTDTTKEDQQLLTQAMGEGFSMPELDLSDPFSAMSSLAEIGAGDAFDWGTGDEEDTKEVEDTFFKVGIDKEEDEDDDDEFSFDFGKGLVW